MTTWESAGEPVQPAYCSSPADLTGMGFSMVPVPSVSCRFPASWGVHPSVVVRLLTLARRVEGPHVEDVVALELAEELKALETGRLLEVGGDGAVRGAGSDEVLGRLDLCGCSQQSPVPRWPCPVPRGGRAYR